jgi:uncharacterized protein YdaU (DUF1376 family)
MRLNCEQRGIYRELLDYLYYTGFLPKDEQVLKKIASASEKEWTRSKIAVLSCFVPHGDGLANNKASEVIEKLDVYSKERRESGKRGANKRWAKQDGKSIAEPIAEPSAKNSHPQPQPTATTPATTPAASQSLENTVVEAPKRATASVDSDTGVALIPAAVNDAMFHGLMGAFLSLGVAISETDLRKCAMLWVSLDMPAKDQAVAHAGINTRGPWAQRPEKFVPRPWNYLQERQWERRAAAPARDRPMSRAESAHNVAAEAFMREKGIL